MASFLHGVEKRSSGVQPQKVHRVGVFVQRESCRGADPHRPTLQGRIRCPVPRETFQALGTPSAPRCGQGVSSTPGAPAFFPVFVRTAQFLPEE